MSLVQKCYTSIAVSFTNGHSRFITLVDEYAGLSHEPSEIELLNEVAAEIPTKWREVGIELGLRLPELDCIEVEQSKNQIRCFSAVFSRWKNQQTSDYTWVNVVKALQAKAVGEQRLAQTLKSKFTRM